MQRATTTLAGGDVMAGELLAAAGSGKGRQYRVGMARFDPEQDRSLLQGRAGLEKERYLLFCGCLDQELCRADQACLALPLPPDQRSTGGRPSGLSAGNWLGGP